MNQLRYSMSHYLYRKTFASFLPGIAGLSGIPMWCFYVNRGQAIASFGIENKNKSIMEFYPAHKSYEYVSSHGFRTFIKIDDVVYEPFALSVQKDSEQHMYINANGLHIEDINHIHNIKVKVSYFVLPNEDFGAFVRAVSVSNLGSKRDIEIIDGMPEVVPMGMSAENMKNMGYTARAWADVVYADTEKSVPVYVTRSLVGDEELVQTAHAGVFFVNFYKEKLNPNLIVDRSIVFEYYDSLSTPVGFLNQNISQLLKKPQYVQNSYSSAFACIQESLDDAGKTGDTLHFQSYFGYAANLEHISSITTYLEDQKQTTYTHKKIAQAERVIADITKDIATVSAYPEFDNYCAQSYMDNVIRGGYPIIFSNKDKDIVYYVYSRKHGDLERDYNFFHLEARPFSQGNGNFRDICQNRRNDVLFNPHIKDNNIKTFVGLLQVDGYNPLVIEGTTLSVDSKYFSDIENECKILFANQTKALLKKFSLGDLAEHLKNKNYGDDIAYQDVISVILKYADYQNQATFGEGYWTDHFCYILDMIESYVEVYPENIIELLYDTYLSYFDSPAKVQARAQKYAVLDETGSTKTQKKRVIQKTAILEVPDKHRAQKERGHTCLVTEDGDIYYGSVFEKLLCLVSNKISALDPSGMGIEMEAGKPGWNDALNGMPGILGAGVSEVFEVLRVVDFLRAHTQQESIELNERIFRFSHELYNIYVQQYSKFQRWDMATTAREQFRDDVYAMPSEKTEVSSEQVHAILNSYKKVLQEAIDTVSNGHGDILPSFINNTAVDFEEATEDSKVVVKVRAFEYRCLPVFLEAPTKSMYVLDKQSARALYERIKKSDLYDKPLKMYKTSESLESESHLIGRAKSFTPGWLERESIFLHMEFKYVLALLKKGLYNEYYQELHSILPCFMDEGVYGRSILEASSFIVSSVNSNPSLRGRGYSARLSGAHAEFLSMWKIMFLGEKLFQYVNEELQFTLSPRLPHAYFPENGTITTTLFSFIQVTIHNPHRQDTFNVLPKRIMCDDVAHEGNIISGELAHKIRDGKVKTVQVFY